MALAVFEILGGLAPATAELPEDLGATERLVSLLSAAALWPEPVQPGPEVDRPARLSCRQLAVGFDGSLLSSVELELGPGRKLGLAGPSGSGKTTLLNALARFVPPREGRVELDGHDLDELLGSQVRAVVGTADQEPHLFNASLAENLRLARPEASDEELMDALVVVGLAELVDGDPAGLMLQVGEGGARLSGGERQRVGLARLVLAAPDLLLLDEPTEGLDDSLASEVLARLSARFASAGLLVVSHRPRDLLGLDEVLLVEAGRLGPERA